MAGTRHAPRAILLDLGGVLIDVSFDRALRHWRACAEAPDLHNSGKPADVAGRSGLHHRPERSAVARNDDLAAEITVDALTDRAYERHERGEIDFCRFAKALDDKLQLNLSEAHWRQGWNVALGKALPGALELVHSAARQWPVFLFSNTNATHHAHWYTQHRELLAPMRAVFVSNELGLRKPDPLAYQAVAAQIGIDAEQIFFFDDREQNVDGARQARLQAFQADGPADVARVLGIDLARG